MDSLERQYLDPMTVRWSRADFIINAIRQHLPQGSLWHEKRFMKDQIESLVLVSTGGVYSVDTFDVGDSDCSLPDSTIVVGDLGVRVLHQTDTHQLLSCFEIDRIVNNANTAFETLLKRDPRSVTTSFTRVTCTMEFKRHTRSTQESAQQLFQLVADAIGYPLVFTPYVSQEIWVPEAEYLEYEESLDPSRSSAELVMDCPTCAEAVTRRIQTLLGSSKSLRPSGIHGQFSGVPSISDLHFIGRSF